MRWVRPPCSTGANGLPVAINAAPSVQRRSCSGVASALLVGLLSGKIAGRSTAAAMARTVASSNWPACPEVPRSAVGFSARTTACSPRSSPRPTARTRSAGQEKSAL